jgi:hypothetical protein
MTKETKMDTTILSTLLFTMATRNLPILVIWANTRLLLYNFHLNRGPDGVPYGGPDGVPWRDGVPDGVSDKVLYENVATANVILMLQFRYDHWSSLYLSSDELRLLKMLYLSFTLVKRENLNL